MVSNPNSNTHCDMFKIITLICALVFNCFTGGAIGALAGFNPVIGAIGMNAVSAVVSVIGTPSGLRAGIYTELWTGELVKKLRAGLDGSWLAGIPDASSVVENDVIHLVNVGVDPDVLVNNTSYPIAIQELADGDIAISLDKFQTKVTPVTDDELYALSYDKMARVKESHGNAINDAKFAKAAHSICAAGSPVIKTTGAVDASTGRKKLTIADIINVKRAMDNLQVPAAGRRLVLCPDHVNDLLGVSENFTRQYNLDPVNGRVARLFGFDIYEYADTPIYTPAGVKQALGSIEQNGNFHCSFAFWKDRVFKATGSTKMYYHEAKTDPQNQRNLINFRHMFIAMPKKADAMAVLVSDYSSSDAPTITGDELIDNVAAAGGQKQRTYATSNGNAVAVQSNADWITAAVASNGKTINLTIAPYAYDAEGTSPRVGTLTVTIPGTSASKTVTVKQLMAENA